MARPLKFPDDVRPDFEGFTPKAFDFLEKLQANNNRPWFKANKETYDREIKFAMECLLGEFSLERRPAEFPVVGDPARGIFRVYRDVRFSKNKSPYKTHAGAVMTRTGTKGEPGLMYVHIQPGQSFVSAGFYSPEKVFLNAWRVRMVKRPGEFLQLAERLQNAQGDYVLGHRGALKSMPRGFSEHADSEVAPFLKWKHFLVSRAIADEIAQGRELIDALIDLGSVAEPLLQYGWDVFALSQVDDPRRHMRQIE